MTPALAEEIGMHLGDGFLSDKKYEYRLKGSKIDEREFYDNFVRTLYKTVYNADVQIREYSDSYGFEFYSKALWTFKRNVVGIPTGNKRGIRVPDVLKVNNQEILAAFLRGYFDTDGSISFLPKNGRPASYPNINVTSASKLLIEDTAEILSMLGLKASRWFDGKYWSIQLCGYGNLFRFCEVIGWNSPKYVEKIRNWALRYPKLDNGACSELVSRGTVDPKYRVRFSARALKTQAEYACRAVC